MTTLQSLVTRGLLLVLAVGQPAARACVQDAAAESKKPLGASMPSNRVGEIASGYLAAFNSSDDKIMREFEEKNRAESALKARPMDERLKMVGELRSKWGTLDFKEVLENDEHGIVVLVHASKSGEFLSLGFQFEKTAPNKLIGIRIEGVESPEALKKKYDNWKDLADLAAQVRKDTDAPAIGIALVKGGTIVDQCVAGVRETDTDEPIKLDDGFHIGSVAKSVTASVVGRLIDAGVLDWSLTLGKALPKVTMRDEYRGVTLEQLMRHRGGIVQHMNFDGPTMTRLVNLPGSPSEQRGAYVAEVLNLEPIHKPGTQMKYSNAGYSIVGHIAETAAGKSWEDLVREHVLAPLEMKRSGIGWPATESNPAQPRGHYVRGNARVPQGLGEYKLGSYLSPAGNVHCSLADLARYAAAHMKGLRGQDGWMKAATIQRLHEPPVDASGERYACGWVVGETRDEKRMDWHNGSAGTFYAAVVLFPDDDLAVVIAANMGAESMDSAAMKVALAVRAKQTGK